MPTNWGHSPDRLEIWKCWFLRRRENRSTRRKTSRSKNENQQQTQPTYDAESGNRTRATLVGGECSHHCAMSSPQTFFKYVEFMSIASNAIQVSRKEWNLLSVWLLCYSSLDFNVTYFPFGHWPDLLRFSRV